MLLMCASWRMAGAQSATPANCTIEVKITGVIGPATVDLLKRVEGQARRENCDSIFLTLNTPGGSLESTRLLVEQIMNAPMPYLCLVSPTGGHAGSAGAIILEACHVNGALAGTNLGAATPISMGEEMPKDLRQKILNDTRSWLESLTRLRGRSDKFGQDIILEAKAVTAEDAFRLRAIDWVGGTKVDFLNFAQGRRVRLSENRQTEVKIGDVKVFELDTRFKVASLLTDPQLAYLLLLGSTALLYFEFTHPGTFIAGSIGAVGLVIAFIALQKLDVEWGGVFLILLGLAMLIAEMFLPTFGILGAGGLVAFVLGSIFLFDPVKSGGYHLPLSLIIPTSILFTLMVVGISLLVLRSARVKKKGGYEDLMGLPAKVISLENSTGLDGLIELRGELWRFQSAVPLNVNDEVRIQGYEGLVLKVKKESQSV
jgi:membrane-bound serine protease (ClpP class)